ncbi:hypothetical protein [Magnetospirillum molischianum]|uniref:Uncharacterized protein n=1 Tax=Magnetospirillum molischianum DSM 120 TaxID=1150626 RepID=H8FYE9_MAGML|nr:hypothetical protein [Magnetospirillum molischianum]CCG43215.1 hypothetical protein PHAMO_80006 [Magnetospirillum molischianum DSM 120]CCG43387.1 hypothetical protein PHAMO_80178 [Magnetospirillum molischianum DSM 120]
MKSIFDEQGHRRFIDKSEDLAAWTDDELRKGIADYQAIIDRVDDSEYSGVAEGDCCADSRDILLHELKRRVVEIVPTDGEIRGRTGRVISIDEFVDPPLNRHARRQVKSKRYRGPR